MNIARIWPSKGPGTQHNHGSRNWPKNLFVENQIAGMGFIILVGLKYRMNKNKELQKWGLKGVSNKKGFHWPPNTGVGGSEMPKSTPEKCQKERMVVINVSKKRRNDRGFGCITDLGGDCGNVEM